MTAGTTIGIINIGSITSLRRVFIETTEIKVPTVEIPKVAMGMIKISCNGTSVRLKIIVKMGIAIVSTIMINMKLLSVLPRKITSRPNGQSISASRHPFSCSEFTILWKLSMPANKNVNQSTKKKEFKNI